MAEDIANIAASIKTAGIMSTAKIMVTLYRAAMKIPDSVPDNDPNVIKGTVVDVRAASTLDKASSVKEFAMQLTQLSRAIDTSLGELGKVKTTIPLRDNFNQEHNPLKASVSTLTEDQEKLLKNIQSLVKDQQSIAELYQQSGKLSRNEFLEKLKPFMSRQDEITMSLVKLHSEEEALWRKLESLYTSTSQAAAVATGAKIEAPKKPTLS